MFYLNNNNNVYLKSNIQTSSMDNLFRHLFLQQLPTHIRAPIAQSKTEDYRALAQEADMIYLAGKSHSQNIQEVNTPNIHQNTTKPNSMRQIMNNMCWYHHVVVYPLPWPLLVGGVRCSRLWSTSQLLRPSGQQCSHSGGVCPQIQGRQCGAYVGAVEDMMCVVCVDVTEGA